MKGETLRAGCLMAIPALMLAAWMAGASAVAWRGLGLKSGRVVDHLVQLVTGRDRVVDHTAASYIGPAQMSDPRLSWLRQAAQGWKPLLDSKRTVVDQVCLVPDATTFFEAIAAWDERYFFPILIDQPAWTLPFLRAFRPARIVRYVRRHPPATSRARANDALTRRTDDALWSEALQAVSRAWSRPVGSDGVLPDAGLPPGAVGVIPPAVVFSSPQAPMLAGAVALAAGRFQPLVRLQSEYQERNNAGDSMPSKRFSEVLSLPQAWTFARRVEQRVASLIPSYDRLGDKCDFVTIAADWPFRYSFDQGDAPIRGLYALDDLVGRRLEAVPRGNWLNQARTRWAYTGRLLGDPAESVAHAMGALFLQPTSALLWNTYHGGQPWSEYAMDRAARELGSTAVGTGAVVHRTGGQADLESWHRTVDPVNRFGMVLINSAGTPDRFLISGGDGRPGDIPRSLPTAVAMIHSFSAADPADPQTIAGRWLVQGAFSYFGSVNEPFLLAFRAPRLVTELMAAEVPFVAALRQGELELFGFQWRLSYLGDPLYHLRAKVTVSDRASVNEAVESETKRRIKPSDWRTAAPGDASWPVVEIARPVARSSQPGQSRVFPSEDAKLQWCLDVAIGALADLPEPVMPVRVGGGLAGEPMALAAGDWPGILREIRRERLDRAHRPFFDELLIDALDEVGATEELMDRLAQIPPTERLPRVWQALETCGMSLLARLSEDGGTIAGFGKVLDLWDVVMGLSFPKDSRFPSHFTERVAALASSDEQRRRLWLDRLKRASQAMAAEPARFAHAAVVAAERRRLEAEYPGPGTRR
jgi:hypothetical protein